MRVLLPQLHMLPLTHQTLDSCSFVAKNKRQLVRKQTVLRYVLTLKKIYISSCLVQLLSINLLSLAGLLDTTG